METKINLHEIITPFRVPLRFVQFNTGDSLYKGLRTVFFLLNLDHVDITLMINLTFVIEPIKRQKELKWNFLKFGHLSDFVILLFDQNLEE